MPSTWPRTSLSPPHPPPPQQAKDAEYLAKNLMAGLPPLGERVQEIRSGTGKAATRTQDNELNFARSQVGEVKLMLPDRLF